MDYNDELTNLWEETIRVLKNYSIEWDEVDAVILDGDCVITKENFEEVARNTNYDSGFGCAEILSNLKIIGWNWWLERGEYDGAEWWVLKTMPVIPNDTRKITSLKGE